MIIKIYIMLQADSMKRRWKIFQEAINCGKSVLCIMECANSVEVRIIKRSLIIRNITRMYSEAVELFSSKRTIITRPEQSYGRVPLAGLCRLFISVYAPGAGLPGARASAFPAPHGSEICPDRAAYSAPAIDTHKAQCRWPWPFPPANTQWHWIRRP